MTVLSEASNGHREFRVRILGATTEVRGPGGAPIVDTDGNQLCEMRPSIEQRILLMLAMRAGNVCSVSDLVLAGWGFSAPGKEIQDKISRLRNLWQLTEIPRGSRSMTGYKLDLPRHEVDALHFIELASLSQPTLEQLDAAMALWRGDPRDTPEFPQVVWTPLDRAVTSLLDHIDALPHRERCRLQYFDRFLEVLGKRAPTRVEPERRGRLLIVEDDAGVADTLKGIFFDFECAVASNVGEAMNFVMNHDLPLRGAIVDRHLSPDLDSAGLQVLAYLRDFRPDVPRILLTSDHPEGPDLSIPNTYGVFEVVTKGGGGKAAPGIREVVERMLQDLRSQATVRLETEGDRLARAIGRKQVLVRRAERQGGETSELDDARRHLDILQEQLEEQRDELTARGEKLSDEAWREEVDHFLKGWAAKVDDA